MAKGVERVQRVVGEAFHRLRNDHEQFLEAYEKPTQIYRFLKARQSLKPSFLYRNLSYMPRRSKKLQRRFRKKLKVDDLLNHTTTREVKDDLASEIKSDNHLRVSFCGIERGISFQNLIGTVSPEDGQCPKETNESSSDKKPQHGQLMEVEILLFKFKQSSIHLSEGAYPYSSSSLGKHIIRYSDPSADEDSKLFQQSSTGKNGEHGITLTIPESVLTWKGSRTPGTQMLVFRATYAKKPVNKPKRTPLHLINFVSRKGCSKNVAVEVNRLNLSDIGQNKGSVSKVKQQLLLCNNHGTTSNEFLFENVNSTTTSPVSAATCGGVHVDGMTSKRTGVSSDQGDSHRLCTQVIANGMPVVNNCTAEKSISDHNSQLEVGNCSLDLPFVTSEAKRKDDLAKHLSQKKAKSKLKRAKMDASVMTEISFGTGTITDMSTISHTSSSSTDIYSTNDQSSTFMSPPSESTSVLPNQTHTLSPPRTKQGFMDKCTSPKILFRNGSFNGLNVLNGYAVPEVAALRGGRVSSKPPKITTNGIDPKAQSIISMLTAKTDNRCGGSGGSGGNLMDHKRYKKRKKYKYPAAGTGKRGTRSFLVSVPRVHYDNQFHHANSYCLDVDAASPQGDGAAGKMCTHRRRSEIQLLLDGDKPPGQRLSATEIPVFTAEDISNRSSRNVTTTSLSSPWHGSSTRKITPVEHFSFPLSPSKRGPLGSFTGNTNISTSPSMLDATTTTTTSTCSNNPRKRSVSNMETASPVSPDCLPFPKQPKVVTNSNPTSTRDCDEKDKKMDAGSTEQPSLQVDVLEELYKYNKKQTNHNKSALLRPPSMASTMGSSSPTPSVESRGTDSVLPDQQNEEVFTAELAVFDSRGECLIKDGEYSILMQSCSKGGSGLSTFVPLTWATVFGGGNDSEVDTNIECPNLLLKFTVHWLKGPPKHRLCTELDTALDLNKIREAYFPPCPTLTPPLSSPPSLTSSLLPGKHKEPLPLMTSLNETREETMDMTELNDREDEILREALLPITSNQHHPQNILFNFLYSNNSLQQTESRYGMICPWCNLSCGKLYSLLKHMTLSHPRFHFTYTPNSDEKCVIDVHVNKMYNAGSSSFDRDPGEWSNISLVQRRSGPSKCLSCSAMLVERHTKVKEDLSEFLNDGSWKRGYNTNRIYYHSHSCLPMVPEEIEAENDEELQTLKWQNISSQKMIDEFTDVNHGEKELMKLWNIFCMENKIIAEKQIPKTCIKFARENGKIMIDKNIVPNFMTHLISLFDFRLITPAILRESMNTVYRLETES